MCGRFSTSFPAAGPRLYNDFFAFQKNLMLYYVALAIYVLVCLTLVLVVLLQQGKGGGMANAFGGGASQAAFGARSGATVLSRATTVCAVCSLSGRCISASPASAGLRPCSAAGHRSSRVRHQPRRQSLRQLLHPRQHRHRRSRFRGAPLEGCLD